VAPSNVIVLLAEPSHVQLVNDLETTGSATGSVRSFGLSFTMK